MNQAIDTFPSLFWGYSAIWAIIVLLVIRIVLKMRSIERRIKSLSIDNDKS